MARKLKFTQTVSGEHVELMTGMPSKQGYRAPEIVQGKPFDGRRADCFALGVALFTMLTRFPPFLIASDEG